ncbi:MAG: hypothetical protein AB8G22_21275 [Saprospiraceae bacterium]
MNNLENRISDPKLRYCLQQIEQKLGWGSSSDWKTRDFEQLSEDILEETETLLSSTTLKRVWGKVKYASQPNLNTLDALAQFAGFNNWRSIQLPTSAPKTQPPKPSPAASTPQELPKKNWWIAFGVLSLGIVLIGFLPNQFSADLQPSDFTFKSRPVAEGLPNSVIFEYDATAVNENDIVEIQQNWDSERRQVIDKNGRIATSIYYYPGYYDAKLVVNDQIMQEHSVYIPTNDWLGVAEQSPVPVYFPKEEIQLEDGGYGIGTDLLNKSGLDPRSENQWVSLHYVKDFGEIRVNDFEFSTTVQNTFSEGAAACQKTEILLLCSGKVIIIDLSIPGCIAENRLLALGHFIDGKTEDLSAFGVDFSKPVAIRITGKDGWLRFFVEGKLAYQVALEEGMDNEIVGVRYRFLGAGKVQDFRLKEN